MSLYIWGETVCACAGIAPAIETPASNACRSFMDGTFQRAMVFSEIVLSCISAPGALRALLPLAQNLLVFHFAAKQRNLLLPL
jgi:hypothetical protein